MPPVNRCRSKIQYFRFVIVAAMLTLGVFGAKAATLTDYRERLEAARSVTDQLLAYIGEGETGELAADYERELVTQIRIKVPATEKIELPTGNIETANQWLPATLEAFQNETDSTKRAVILTEVSERLTALAEKVRELENPHASTYSKDEDKQKLAEILRREEYQKPKEAQESAFQKWLREFVEWLLDLFPKPNLPTSDFSGMSPLRYVLYALLAAAILGLLAFIVYKLAPSISPRFRRQKKKEKERVILGERIAANESSRDLFDEAERMAAAGEMRAAIRKGYVAALCELSDRKVIGLAQHKTNRDYLRDVRSRKPLFERLRGMTNSFERHWYGDKPAETKDWDEFRREYKILVGSWQ